MYTVYYALYIHILGQLFPLSISDVLSYITTIVSNWHSLGVWLHMSCHVLEEIRTNNPQDVVACKEQMISRWMNNDSLASPHCWWSLVKALKGMGENGIARKIENEHGKL